MTELVEIDMPSVGALAGRLHRASAALSQDAGISVPSSIALSSCADNLRAFSDCVSQASRHVGEAAGVVGLACDMAVAQAVSADRFGPST